MKVRWSPAAISDLESIRAYIARDNPAAAARVAGGIKAAVLQLCAFPLSGRVGRVPDTRELVVPGTSYIAAYAIKEDEVRIAAVLHGSQKWPESF